MAEITDRQQEVHDFLTDFVNENGYSPTLRQISANFGWSGTKAAQDHLQALERKGYLRNTPRGYLPAA